MPSLWSPKPAILRPSWRRVPIRWWLVPAPMLRVWQHCRRRLQESRCKHASTALVMFSDYFFSDCLIFRRATNQTWILTSLQQVCDIWDERCWKSNRQETKMRPSLWGPSKGHQSGRPTLLARQSHSRVTSPRRKSDRSQIFSDPCLRARDMLTFNWLSTLSPRFFHFHMSWSLSGSSLGSGEIRAGLHPCPGIYEQQPGLIPFKTQPLGGGKFWMDSGHQ